MLSDEWEGPPMCVTLVVEAIVNSYTKLSNLVQTCGQSEDLVLEHKDTDHLAQ